MCCSLYALQPCFSSLHSQQHVSRYTKLMHPQDFTLKFSFFCELCSQKHLAEHYQWTAARIFLLAQIRTYVRFSVVHTILNQFTCQAPTRHIKILFFMLSQTNCKVIFTGGIIPEYGCEILVYPETDKTPVNFEMNRIRLLYCRFPVSNSTI